MVAASVVTFSLVGCGASEPAPEAPVGPPVGEGNDSVEATRLNAGEDRSEVKAAEPEEDPDRCGCFVLSVSKEGPDSVEECVEKVDGEYVLKPEVRERIEFEDAADLVEILSECGPFYLNKEGTLRKTHFFDNGCDPFSEGMARAVKDKKYGYMNVRLEIVVEPAYEYAYPFDCGYGQVCNDCTTEYLGEHYTVKCETCGLVDRKGELVVPLGSSEDEVAGPTLECTKHLR